MKALQIIKPRSFSTIEVPIPQLEADSSGQVLVRTTWISMCGSDIPFFTGSKRYQTFPFLWGSRVHECVDQVAECTSERFQVGDWVVAIPEKDQGLAEFYLAQDSKVVRLTDDLKERPDSCLIQPLSTVINSVDRFCQ
jgi:NADPH:quinone reductase-like Zn-dependent oxidoreductase